MRPGRRTAAGRCGHDPRRARRGKEKQDGRSDDGGQSSPLAPSFEACLAAGACRPRQKIMPEAWGRSCVRG
ncbi:hypothetical protein C7S16_5304 [Burkholderia thailandensis]|uniref:Uncharacterized protein n=1 Tax=Burkholderia thailandensis TaxID=57975 RepID=A0AAW9CPJ9_BURTH|nr:hypothetical protein [Burkholderia thailandensis]MDW9251521.1 hypothetical protein [Burkholderia thailandensis]